MERNSKVRMSRTDRKKREGKNKIRSIWGSLKYINSFFSTLKFVLSLTIILLLVLARLGDFAGSNLLVLYQFAKIYGDIIINFLIA
ncbi:hypothetical protein [Priestia megaterium]|uniref:hypothetical protein n=1 Tax=Priestia megaterium TaxID=1404 RepID=UPI002FFF74FB